MKNVMGLSLAAMMSGALVGGAVAGPVETEILDDYFAFANFDFLTLSKTATETGDSSVWTEVTITDQFGFFTMKIPKVEVAKRADGAHDFIFSETLAMTVTLPDGPNEENPFAGQAIDLVYTLEDAGAIVSGERDKRTYAFDLGKATAQSLENDLLDLKIEMTDLKSNITVERGDSDGTVRRFTGSQSVKEMSSNYAIKLEGQEQVNSATYKNINTSFDLPIPSEVDVNTPLSFLTDDFAMAIKTSFDSAVSLSTVTAGIMNYSVAAQSGKSQVDISFNDQVLAVDIGGVDMDYVVDFPMMGLQGAKGNADEFVAKIGVPLGNQESVKTAKYKIALDGLTLSENVWGLFDPLGALPRDKASIDIDAEAGLRWLIDLRKLNPETPPSEQPVEISSAKINALNLRVAGAELETKGDVVLNNVTFPPIPVGSVDVSLKGGLSLLAKLTEIGLVPQATALGIRGMSGVFTRKGEGEDHLLSTIELKPDGGITANGMPLK